MDIRAAELATELMRHVNGVASEARAQVSTFFDGYRLDLDPPAQRPPLTAAERAYADGLAANEDTCARLLASRTKEIAKSLRAADDKRVEQLLQVRVKQRVQEVGARIQKSASELRSDIQAITGSLELPPELAAEEARTIALINEAIASTRGWMAKTAEVAGKVARGMLRIAINIGSLGLLDLPDDDVQAEGPSLDEAKAAGAELLSKLHQHVTERKKALPDFGQAPAHVQKAESLIDQLLAAERLGELAAKFTKLEALREAEPDPDIKRQLGVVLARIKQERGMKEMLGQVSAFCEGADLLSAEAAKGGVAVELAPAVDAVMRAAEAVRTQWLGAGAYKKTVSALARAIERIDELAHSAHRLPQVLEVVRSEMKALSDRIHEMFAGRSDLLTIESGNYREMLKSLSGADGGQSAAESVEAAFEPIARLREIPIAPEPNVEALVDCLDEMARVSTEVEAEDRPERAARLTVIDVSFDRTAEIDIPVLPKKKEPPETAAAREEVRALQLRILATASNLEDRAAERSGELSRERDRLLAILSRLEDGAAVEALEGWNGRVEELRAELEALAASPEGVRGFARALGTALEKLRGVAAGLRGLEQVPDTAIAKIESVIAGARPLESAFSSDRFLHLGRDWAAGALLAVTETAGILDARAAEAAAGPKDDAKGREAPMRSLAQLVERLAVNPGRLGAWSRLSLLMHAEQRLAALPGHDEALLKQIRSAVKGYRAITGGPEAEHAAADILEATIELGASMIKARKIEQEAVAGYAALAETVTAILEPGREKTDADRSAITRGIEQAETLARLPGASGTSAREVSQALGHLRSEENAVHLKAIRTRVRDSASSYLAKVRDARLVLDEATRAFVEYDPLNAKAPLAEAARDLRRAITDATEVLSGPAAVVLAKTLIELADRLEDIADKDGPAAAEARRLVEELDPLLRRARVVGEVEDAPARFVDLVRDLEERTDRSHPPTDELAGWADRASEALLGLMVVDDAELAAMLAKVEAEHFPHLAEKAKAHQDELAAAAAAEREITAVTPVAATGMARMLEGDVAEARARLRALAGGFRAGAPAAPDGTRLQGEERDLVPEGVEAPKPESKLGPIERAPIADGQVTTRSDKAEMVALSTEGLRGIRKRMQKAADQVAEVGDLKEAILTEFEQFIEDNAKLVEEMAATLRQFPGLETVLVLDQSESADKKYGDSRIIDQERASMALILAAHMRAERNCAVVGFGGHVGDSKPVSVVEGAVDGTVEIPRPKDWDDVRAQPVNWQLRSEQAVLGSKVSEPGDPIMKRIDGHVVFERVGPSGRARYYRQVDTHVCFQGDVNIYAHKPMAVKLTPTSADYAFRMAKKTDGWTDFIEPGNVALGQFTERANNKLILFLTDAELNGASDVRRWIDDVRGQHVGFAMLGFGDAQHVRKIAGDFGEHVSSYSQAIHKTKELFLRTVIANANKFKGQVKGAADGVGTPDGQAPLSPAPSDGPMEQALLLSTPTNIAGDPAEVFATRGPKRELENLVDRGRYERAVKELDRRHLAVSKSASYKQCLKEVRMLRARHEREGTIEALSGAIQPTLPKSRGVEWERKQLSGSSFDEQQLILYVAGLAQGVPVQRIFKRRKGSDETKAHVVLALDESSSMGDTEKMRANLEALIAYGDALKATDPEIKIAVVGYGDKVRLHAGFEQDWNEELKAHLLHQAKGTYDATDDERAAVESIGLLRMMDAEVGMVLNFSDGQGMPGMEGVMRAANEEGYAFLTCGVGPDCVSVSRFGAHGFYARNLSQMVQKLGPRLFKSWELAGRLS